MTQPDLLQAHFPGLAERLPRVLLAALPTPLRRASLDTDRGAADIWIKDDRNTGSIYGGNKVRKLEYLFGRIDRRRVDGVATYGTVASNHALATAMYAVQLGYRPICFLAHQTRTSLAAAALATHLGIGTQLVPYRGNRRTRIDLQRKILRGHRVAVIPMGGSSWAGCPGFMTAGLELAAQIDAGEMPCPDRLYVATGTMGTAAGLALGLALAELPTEVHAVRVSDVSIANQEVIDRLMRKSCYMLHRLDNEFPESLHRRVRLRLRNGFFGPGYAKGTAATDEAIAVAKDQAALQLERTYTGKAFAALLHDLREDAVARVLFWNTYSGLPQSSQPLLDLTGLPDEFHGYLRAAHA